MDALGFLEQSQEGLSWLIQSFDPRLSDADYFLIVDALHKSRLLSVEEKPFKRVTKRLLSSNVAANVSQSAPPRRGLGGSIAAAVESERLQRARERRQFQEDVALDFAAFDSSIARCQFSLTSNERERERYAVEKVKILEASQAVRESTAQLHRQLAEARRVMEVRKTWDRLTEKITNNRMLRPREDQATNLERLQAEIAELEGESAEYAETWAKRRQQFDRIVKETTELRRMIRDEDDRPEGLEDREHGKPSELAPTSRDLASVTTSLPRNHLGPGLDSVSPTSSSALLHRGHPDVSPSRGRSSTSSHTPSTSDDDGTEEGEDITMGEQGEITEDGQEGGNVGRHFHLKAPPDDVSRLSSARMSITSAHSPSPAHDTPLHADDRDDGELADESPMVQVGGEDMDIS